MKSADPLNHLRREPLRTLQRPRLPQLQPDRRSTSPSNREGVLPTMTVELDNIDKWFHEIPENWRGQPPRDLEERIKYNEFMIQHVRKCEHFTTSQKLKLVHQLGLDLEKTDTKLHNRHECECCGITLHVSDQIGPECAKHPDKFPCNTHRREACFRTNVSVMWSVTKKAYEKPTPIVTCETKYVKTGGLGAPPGCPR
jgi:hypothetical protein